MEPRHTERVVIRRAPKARAFVVVGIILGIVGIVAVSLLFPPDAALGATLVTGYFLLWGTVVGLVGGLVVWLWVDRRSKRRAHELDAEKLGPADDTTSS
jgi:uncharacterized membrane protein YbhN (UPF0104 family)